MGTFFCPYCGAKVENDNLKTNFGNVCQVAHRETPQSSIITKGQLTLAGWLSITNAAVTIPIVILSVFMAVKGGSGAKITQVVLTLISLGLFVYVFSSLKRLLNFLFQFHDVDTYILLLIWGNVGFSILGALSLGSGKLETVVSVLSVVAFIAFGILFMIFAIRILRLSDNLFGLLKPFSYISIGTGICFATLVLFPLGLIGSIASDVILGIIFFKEAENWKKRGVRYDL
jgi:hypothetical protein